MAALTHIDFAVVQRSRGGCPVKTAAYIMCGALARDDGTAYDFSRRKRGELIHSEILLPDGAPESLRDPRILWNAADAADTRINSQTARQILLTIPRECPEHLRVDLARTVAERWRQQGMGIQFAVHCPRAADGSEQPHVHYQLTMRAVLPTGLAEGNKNRAWHEQFRENKGRAERARICDDANTFFALRDLQIRLDPRTLSEQNIDRPPEPDAPRQAWEAFKRMGADPEAAPAPVAAVLRHRELRRELRKHEDYQSRIAVQIAADKRAISLAKAKAKTESTKPKTEDTMTPWNQDHEGYDPLLPDEKFLANQAFAKFKKMNPDKAEGMDISSFVRMRQSEFAKLNREGAQMQSKPEKTGPQKAAKKATHPAEPWMEKMGGYDALSESLRASAKASYQSWLDDADRAEQKAKRKEFGLYRYTDYVQEKFAERRAEEEKIAAKKAASPDDKAPTESKKSIRAARETEESKQEFASYVHKLLSERYTVPEGLHDFVKRIDISKDTGEAVLTLKSGGKLIDTGSQIRTDADVNDALAAATVATAHARGWTSLVVTGSDDYKHAIARAAALHEPPITTDIELPKAIREEIQAALVERARAALKESGNSVAPRPNSVAPGAGQPVQSAAQAQATAALDRAQARQQAELAGEPKGFLDAKALAEPRIAELQAQLEAARLAAEEARSAADDHAREFPLMRRLMDQGARARHAALEVEAARLAKVADKLANGHDKAVDRIKAEARKEAKSAEKAHDDWRYQPQVRRAQKNLADIERLRAAVAVGDQGILEAINNGKINDAISKLPEFESSQTQKARAARSPEQIRGQAIDAAFAEADKCARDPVRKEAAMEAMRAASDGDPATIAALDSGNKMDEAMKAAAAWRRKLDEEAAKIKKAREEKEALERRNTPPAPTFAQP